MKKRNRNLLTALGALTLSMAIAPAHGAIIILDTFTAEDGTNIEGRAPDAVNLPGGVWDRNNLFWGSSISGNRFNAGPDTGWTTLLASSGGYTRPSNLTVSADLELDTLTDGGGGAGGLAIGFNTTDGESYSTFTGLVLHQNGTLTYRQEGADIASVPWSGGSDFNASSVYHLSYDVNTSTGALSGISLTDSTADFSSLVAAGDFTSGRTPFAAMYANGGGGGDKGFIDNFEIQGPVSIPAPVALPAGLALLSLTTLKRRRRA